MMIPPNQRDKTHLRVWFSDVRAARAVGWAGPGQGRARYIKHVFGGCSMGVVTVLKAHLGAGWHDPSGGGRGRQSSDIYRAEERHRMRLKINQVRADSSVKNSSDSKLTPAKDHFFPVVFRIKRNWVNCKLKL